MRLAHVTLMLLSIKPFEVVSFHCVSLTQTLLRHNNNNEGIQRDRRTVVASERDDYTTTYNTAPSSSRTWTQRKPLTNNNNNNNLITSELPNDDDRQPIQIQRERTQQSTATRFPIVRSLATTIYRPNSDRQQQQQRQQQTTIEMKQDQPRLFLQRSQDSSNQSSSSRRRRRRREKMKPMPVRGYDGTAIEEYYDYRPLEVGWRLNSLGLPLLGKLIIRPVNNYIFLKDYSFESNCS